ncbi:unnamed protein product [Coffea canephora]|uniref:Senescence regulator n=1 Tax=Coffea canephora TaxID=49390 RepID=A0A068U787_COFCA|nr:uncharacterized protein LOC113709266 [Coffea arabica]CDP04405.1 unnamed protein product [Coffea canephora]
MAEFDTGGDGKESMLEEQDMQEEDVWGAMRERDSSGLKSRKAKESPSACRIPPLPRVVPRVPSGSFDPRAAVELVVHQRHHHPNQSSAPLDISNWSEIYGTSKNSPDINSNSRKGACAVKADDHGRLSADSAKCDDDDDDSEEMIPPHEIVARRMARSPVVSYSMCEGVGRTLKGRDLCTLRNAILAKTGFLES